MTMEPDRLQTMLKILDVLPKWTPISDGLPDADGQYLCTEVWKGKHHIVINSFAKNLYDVDKYDFAEFKDKKQAGFYDYDSDFGYRCERVIAWMPLPEAYKERERE